ncbi:hypothetical protein EG329_011468 [Mollisiaceae sp. DMI_Dod_QoI]|nr:hypothetical protein EG329_011468 [Helotiales sp. DMI_Dod_QoI]
MYRSHIFLINKFSQISRSIHVLPGIMANAIFNLLATNQIARGLPLGPSSLAWKIGSLFKAIGAVLNQDDYHPTTIELNAAFLELISAQPHTEAKTLLEEWAFCSNGNHSRRSHPNQDHLAVLEALVSYILSGLYDVSSMNEGSIKNSIEQDEVSKKSHQVVLMVQRMRNRVQKIVMEAALGRAMTEEEELVMLVERTI